MINELTRAKSPDMILLPATPPYRHCESSAVKVQWMTPDEENRHDRSVRKMSAVSWGESLLPPIIQAQSHRDVQFAHRLYLAALALADCVDIDPDRRGGAPVLKGTRFPIAQIISQMAEGDSVDDLVENFDLNGDLIRQCLRGLSDFLARQYAK